MENNQRNTYDVYKDISERTKGEIYLGIVGPVRTGKSTFIKRFADIMILPNMSEEHAKTRTKDELPQSASGTTIMTTEPKFVPKDAVQLKLAEDVEAKVRLIDCVGYMVEGATGHIENEEERKVKTPWFDGEIPFTKAAAIGTQKVIQDHSTIGIVLTTDGSIGEIPRENYIPAEERTIKELQSIGKPFLMILNTVRPYSEETKKLVAALEEKYQISVLPLNCQQMSEEDIRNMMELVLLKFPVTEVQFFIPTWVEMLEPGHRIKLDLMNHVREMMDAVSDIRDATQLDMMTESPYIDQFDVSRIELDTGKVRVKIEFDRKYYYEVLSEWTGTDIKNEQELIVAMKELSSMKGEYAQIKDAFADVRMKGYGVVSPTRDEITLEDPVIIKQGNKFGVKIHSEAPSIHMIRANIENEIAPIVGSEQQAQDLIQFIKDASETKEGVWGTNIFGKSIEDLVLDGMRSKITMINEESQEKLQSTMQKIVNESKGGLVCIII